MAGSDRPSPATFLLTRNAALDLRRIHALSRREWGDDVADRYLADLYAAMGDAAANPERGRGMLISDGVRNWQVAQDGQALDLSGWHLDSLFIQVPNSLLGDHGLELRATSVEPSNGSTASRSATFTLRALSGAAVATPANANAFVSLMSQSARTSASTGRVELVSASQVVGADNTEAAATSPQREAWLVELERRSRKQWEALMAKS